MLDDRLYPNYLHKLDLSILRIKSRSHCVNHGAATNGYMHANGNGVERYRPTPADIKIDNHKPTDPTTILFKNVNIIDSTGREPFLGDVLIEGERIVQVGKVGSVPTEGNMAIIDGEGKKTIIIIRPLRCTHPSQLE
jgi:hypothetical protein